MSEAIIYRLEGIRRALITNHLAGGEMSSATRGHERELFVKQFLSEVFPPTFRFGTGDAIDHHGEHSGQLDVVIERSFFPSLPSLAISSPRLYFAEGIAAVIEVKSDLRKQWRELERTANALRSLEPVFQAPGFTPFGPPLKRIPIFAVGYVGWENIETIKEKADTGVVDGILIIEPGLFCTRSDFPNGGWAHGSLALWGMISALHYCTYSVVLNAFSPIEYVSHLAEEGA